MKRYEKTSGFHFIWFHTCSSFHFIFRLGTSGLFGFCPDGFPMAGPGHGGLFAERGQDRCWRIYRRGWPRIQSAFGMQHLHAEKGIVTWIWCKSRMVFDGIWVAWEGVCGNTGSSLPMACKSNGGAFSGEWTAGNLLDLVPGKSGRQLATACDIRVAWN